MAGKAVGTAQKYGQAAQVSHQSYASDSSHFDNRTACNKRQTKPSNKLMTLLLLLVHKLLLMVDWTKVDLGE